MFTYPKNILATPNEFIFVKLREKRYLKDYYLSNRFYFILH